MEDPASEPMANLSETSRRLMKSIGPVWSQDVTRHRDLVLKTYAPLLRDAGNNGVNVLRDLAYGPHERHKVDVFNTPGMSAAPVVLFVHGGAFVRGSKSTPEGIYDNVLQWFARNGCLGINVEYRLAPEAQFPSGAEDVASAFEWTANNASKFGGDPSRIFLVGHSAGATHIATYVLDPNLPQKPKGLSGFVLLSGRLRIDALPENPMANGVRAYFGDDTSQYELRSPMSYAHLCQLPVMIAIAEHDNPLLDVYGAEFFWRLSAARKRTPRFLRLRGHNHSSMVMHFNSGEEILGREILSFMANGS